jgi:hypothetical protein
MNSSVGLASKRAASPEAATSSNKRIRAPGRVVHLRSLPVGVTDHEILALLGHFGPVERTLLLTMKNQALVQFQSADDASRCIAYFTQTPPFLRGVMVRLQFSDHEELKSSTSNSTPTGAVGTSTLFKRCKTPNL